VEFGDGFAQKRAASRCGNPQRQADHALAHAPGGGKDGNSLGDDEVVNQGLLHGIRLVGKLVGRDRTLPDARRGSMGRRRRLRHCAGLCGGHRSLRLLVYREQIREIVAGESKIRRGAIAQKRVGFLASGAVCEHVHDKLPGRETIRVGVSIHGIGPHPGLDVL